LRGNHISLFLFFLIHYLFSNRLSRFQKGILIHSIKSKRKSMDAEVLRSLERLVVVLVGGLSVYLGYRLFLNLPEQKDSEGRVNLPGNISVYFSRVGPGVFFALFGALIVTASLYFTITIYDAKTGKMVMRGLGPQKQKQPGTSGQAAIDQANLKGDLALLNTVEPQLATETTSAYRADWKRTLPRIKLALLKASWQSNWGDYEQFESAVLEGDYGRLASQPQTPLQLYHSGKK
jgi:hypothetical protein